MSCLFFPPVSTSALVSSHMLSYFAKREKKTETRLKNDAFHRRGLENTKWNLMWMSDELQASPPVTRWRHTVRPPQRLVVVLYDYFFLQHFFFFGLFSTDLWVSSALHVCNKRCSVLYFCNGFLPPGRGGANGLHESCPPFRLSFRVIWFNRSKKKKEKWDWRVNWIDYFKIQLKKKCFFSTTDYER